MENIRVHKQEARPNDGRKSRVGQILAEGTRKARRTGRALKRAGKTIITPLIEPSPNDAVIWMMAVIAIIAAFNM